MQYLSTYRQLWELSTFEYSWGNLDQYICPYNRRVPPQWCLEDHVYVNFEFLPKESVHFLGNTVFDACMQHAITAIVIIG